MNNSLTHHWYKTVSFRLVSLISLVSTIAISLIACDTEGEQDSSNSQTSQSVHAPHQEWSVTQQAKYDLWQSYAQNLDEDGLQTLRISLGIAQGNTVDAEDVLNEIFSPLKTQVNLKASGKIYEGLKASTRVQSLLKQGQSGLLRIDSYELKSDLKPLKVLGVRGTKGVNFPFDMSLGTHIRFIRLYATENEAQKAQILTPLDLPFDVERALALPEGCIVEIPVTTQVNLQATGQLLSKAAKYAPQLVSFLTTSTQGFLSATIQGSLMMKSAFQIWVIRGEADHVRIKIHQNREHTLQTQFQAQANATQALAFIPAAQVQKIRQLKDQFVKWGKTPGEKVSTLKRNIERLTKGLPRALKFLLEREPTQIPAIWQDRFDQALQVTDQSLVLLQQGHEMVEAADTWITREIDQRLGAVNRTLNPAFDWVKKHSEHALNFQASIAMSDQFIRQIDRVADYVLQLNHPTGQLGFKALMGGEIQWEGLHFQDWKNHGFIDLTWADALAQQAESGIQKLNDIQLKQSHRQQSIKAITPVISAHFNRTLSTYELEIETQNQEGVKFSQHWFAELWRQDQGLHAHTISQNESWSNGLIYPVSIAHISEDLESNDEHNTQIEEATIDMSTWSQGAYWFSWVKQWPSYERDPLTRTLSEILNISGKLGALTGVPALYQDDVAGSVRSRFTMIFDGAFLHYFFQELDPKVIWVAAGEMAQTFDNKFTLPFIPSFTRPAFDSAMSQEACDQVAYQWGGQYCWTIQKDIVMPLLALREMEIDEVERVMLQQEYLSKLYRIRLLANPIGTRVITRLLAEIAYWSNLETHVHIQVNIQHENYPAAVFRSHLSSIALQDDSEQDDDEVKLDQWRTTMEVAQQLGLATHIKWLNE